VDSINTRRLRTIARNRNPYRRAFCAQNNQGPYLVTIFEAECRERHVLDADCQHGRQLVAEPDEKGLRGGACNAQRREDNPRVSTPL